MDAAKLRGRRLNPLPGENFVDGEGRLSFFSGYGMNLRRFREELRDRGNPGLRARLIAATLDPLRPDDALQFVKLEEILAEWPGVEKQLAASRPLWEWMVETGLRELPGLCRPERSMPPSPGRRPAGDGPSPGPDLLEERLACELAQFWREPRAAALAGIRSLHDRGARVDPAIRLAPHFAPLFSPLELAYKVAHAGFWAEVEDFRTASELRQFASTLSVRLLELCFEEAIAQALDRD